MSNGNGSLGVRVDWSRVFPEEQSITKAPLSLPTNTTCNHIDEEQGILINLNDKPYGPYDCTAGESQAIELAAGTYTVTVKALCDGTPLFSGEVECEVNKGKNSECVVTMEGEERWTHSPDNDEDDYSPCNLCSHCDCDDEDGDINPESEEICDNDIDDDCDEKIDRADPGCPCQSHIDCDDSDPCTDDECLVDGTCEFTANQENCDDGDPCTYPDECLNMVCMPGPDHSDEDGDGQASLQCGGLDCNDGDPTIYYGNPEICDGKDNDCSAGGFVPPGDEMDNDGDGYVECAPWQGSGGIIGGGDCDDVGPCGAGCSPGLEERLSWYNCFDGFDNDCDGGIDLNDNNSDCNSPGLDCTNPIVISSLPFTHNATTRYRGNDYWSTCLDEYDGGQDVVYRLDAWSPVIYIYLNPLGTPYTGIAFGTPCPPSSSCWPRHSDSGDEYIFSFQPSQGTTYYIMVDKAPYVGNAWFDYELEVRTTPWRYERLLSEVY
ncbi:putative metal-binding motif-containing protein [Thermodesulfobacteriota bacterium]